MKYKTKKMNNQKKKTKKKRECDVGKATILSPRFLEYQLIILFHQINNKR